MKNCNTCINYDYQENVCLSSMIQKKCTFDNKYSVAEELEFLSEDGYLSEVIIEAMEAENTIAMVRRICKELRIYGKARDELCERIESLLEDTKDRIDSSVHYFLVQNGRLIAKEKQAAGVAFKPFVDDNDNNYCCSHWNG